MTSLSKDRRVKRPNKMKRDGHCGDCGKSIPIYFAVEKCNGCLWETTDAFEDCRHGKPPLVRYNRYKIGMNA